MNNNEHRNLVESVNQVVHGDLQELSPKFLKKYKAGAEENLKKLKDRVIAFKAGSGTPPKISTSRKISNREAGIKAAKELIGESVELDEAWTADSVIRNAEIGSKKGYGINIKKTGEITKTPYKHMLMTNRPGKVEEEKKKPMFKKRKKKLTPEEEQAQKDYYHRAGKPFGRRVASRAFNLGDENPPITTVYDHVEIEEKKLRYGKLLDISKKLGRFGKMTHDEMQGKGMSDQEWKDAEIRIANKEAEARKKKNESVELDEGRMKEIGIRRKEGETPEQIAKGMDVHVSVIKKILQGLTPAVVKGRIQGSRLNKDKFGTGNVYKADTVQGKHIRKEKKSMTKKTDKNSDLYKTIAKIVDDSNTRKIYQQNKPTVKVKTKSGTEDEVSHDDLRAAGERLDKIKKENKKENNENLLARHIRKQHKTMEQENQEEKDTKKKIRQLQNKTAVAYAMQKTELEPGNKTAEYNKLAKQLDKLKQRSHST